MAGGRGALTAILAAVIAACGLSSAPSRPLSGGGDRTRWPAGVPDLRLRE
jgi:hypothetical protein